LFTPPPIVGCGVEGPERRVVQDGLVGLDECVSHALPQRPPRSGLEVGQKIGWDRVGVVWLWYLLHAF
jgi:hypothetical protein